MNEYFKNLFEFKQFMVEMTGREIPVEYDGSDDDEDEELETEEQKNEPPTE